MMQQQDMAHADQYGTEDQDPSADQMELELDDDPIANTNFHLDIDARQQQSLSATPQKILDNMNETK